MTGMYAPSKEIELIEVGSHMARVIGVVDLGVHLKKKFRDDEEDTFVRFIELTYELCHCFMKDDDGNDLEDKPRWISEFFPWYSLKSDKAKSTSRYNAIDPGHKFKGDWSQLINGPVGVTVVHNEKGSRTFNNVGDVTPIPKGIEIPPLKNDPLIFSMDNPDKSVWDRLPQWKKEKITSAKNFKGSPVEEMLSAEEGSSNKEPEAPEMDEVPF